MRLPVLQRRILAIFLCAVLALSISACRTKSTKKQPSNVAASTFTPLPMPSLTRPALRLTQFGCYPSAVAKLSSKQVGSLLATIMRYEIPKARTFTGKPLLATQGKTPTGQVREYAALLGIRPQTCTVIAGTTALMLPKGARIDPHVPRWGQDEVVYTTTSKEGPRTLNSRIHGRSICDLYTAPKVTVVNMNGLAHFRYTVACDNPLKVVLPAVSRV